MSVQISHTTKRYPTTLPYQQIKDAILGKRYNLSLVFIGNKTAHQLNQTYRDKNTVPDVLSFPLTATAGEIYLCLPRIRSSYKKFAHTYEEHVGYLFIHGLLHLKGFVHGATMEQAEKRFANRFVYAERKSP